MNARTVDRALIGAFASVVLTFLGASWFGQHRAELIEQSALSIQGNAAPSIRRLAGARAELRRLQLLVHRALDEDSPRRRIVEIDAGRELLEREVAEYRQLPRYGGEEAVWQRAEAGFSAMDAEVAAIVAAVQGDDLERARGHQQRLDEMSEALALELSRGIELNVTAASQLAAHIGEIRQRGLLWAIVFDGAGVLLSLLAATLSLRISRAHVRAVQAFREVAERRADELEQFAARMAHDVRTPLSAMGLSMELAEKYQPGDPRFDRATRRARAGFLQTMTIIDALFEFARAGARPQPGARSSVATVAEDVAAVMRAHAEEIGADIVLHVDSQSLVPCSAGVLESAIGNLVGNALTYVDGAPTRCVTIETADEDRVVRTTVSDTGPGLPNGVVADALFEPYVRGERARGRGLGLGLATVKRIVEAHGGHVGVQSSSKGCAFWFTLPRVIMD